MKKEKTKIVAGIDVGTSKVCTTIAEMDFSGNFNLIGVGLSKNSGMQKGQVIDLDSVTQAVYQSLGEAEKSAGIVIDSAFVSIAGSHVTANSKRGTANVTDQVRGISIEDMRRAIDDSKNLLLPPDKQIIDVVDLEYMVDTQSGIRDPLGMSGSHIEVLVQIITGSSAFVQNLTKCVMKVGIHVDGVVYAPMAAGESVLNKDEKRVGMLLLDLGAGTTDVAVYQGGHLRNAWSIPVGGNHLDNDIAVRFGISHAEAERVKIEHGKAYMDGRDEGVPVQLHHVGGRDKTQVPRGMVCQVIQPRVVELMEMVQAGLEENMPPGVLPAGVVVTGGASLLQGMEYVVEQVLGYNVRIGSPIYHGQNAELVSGPEFATAVGLIQFSVRHSFRKSATFGTKGFKGFPQGLGSMLKGFFRLDR